MPPAGNSLRDKLASIQNYSAYAGDLRKCDLESFLDGFQDLLIGLGANERNRKTLGTETTSTTNTMEVRIGVAREIVVNS